MMSIRVRAFFLGVVCLLAAPLYADQPATTYLLHLPGIGGHRNIDDYLINGIQRGGLDASIEIYDWTCNTPGLLSLTALDRNHHEAQLIAEHLTTVYRAHPNQRIILSGHSGGAGVAVWTLEDLPDDVHVDTLVMLASAMSPQYDLTKALSHVSGKAYVFVSPLDPILGLGTRNFGTIDRVYTDAAGRVGFIMPKTADATEYAKLVSIPYNPAWMRWGNSGDHIGEMMRPFAQNFICPLLLTGNLPILMPTTQPTAMRNDQAPMTNKAPIPNAQ